MSSTTRPAGPLQGFTLLSCITLAVMGALLIVPVIPQMMKAFKGTPNLPYWIGMVITIPSLCVAILSPVWGWLGDRVGRRKLLIPVMGLYSLCGLAPFFLHDLTQILISRIGVGITEAAAMTLSTTMIGDLFSGSSRDKWLAGQTATASTSAVVFLIIGGLAGRYGWQGPFIVYLFPLVLMFALMGFTWETGNAKDHAPEPPHMFAAPEPDSTPVVAPATSGGKVRFPYAFIAGVCAITLVASLMFYTVQIQLSVALDALGIKDPAEIGLLTAVASLAVPVGTFVFWLVSKRLGIPVLLMVEFALMGGAYIAMSKTGDYRYFVAFAAVSQIGAGMILPTLLTWAMSRLAFEVRGAGTGVWQSTFALGQFVVGLLVPFIASQVGGIIPAFTVLGGISLVAAVFALIGAVTVRKKLQAA